MKDNNIHFLHSIQSAENPASRNIAKIFLAIHEATKNDYCPSQPSSTEVQRALYVCSEIKNCSHADILDENFEGHFAVQSTIAAVAQRWKKDRRVLNHHVPVDNISCALLKEGEFHIDTLNSFLNDCIAHLRAMQRELKKLVSEPQHY